MQLFDSHAHLESPRFDPDREQVIARACSAGVTRMLSCGSDLATSEAEVLLSRQHQGIYAAVGIHAHEASSALRQEPDKQKGLELDEQAFERLREMAMQRGVVALGEIGLDYHYDFSPREAQRLVLARQLALAVELDLPVVLHNREADHDLRRLVEAAPRPLCGVLHCFLADQEMAHWALARGFYIGVAGPITFEKVRHLPDIVRRIPLDRLLIETDAPYLTPRPKRGQRNEPALVRYVAERLAEILGLPLENLAQRTTENACQLFGIR
jgi:TatD DNase family protein